MPGLAFAQLTEIEPNESFAQATNWTFGQSMSGSECNPPSFDADHFRIVLPHDGVITFTVTSQGSGPAPGNLQFALFHKSGFYAQYHTLPGTTSPTTQSFSHSCLSGDTMFVRVQEDLVGPSSCISYVMTFTVDPALFANDILPNDDFANPQPVALGTPIEGHLNFLYDGTMDVYGVTLPEDGSLRIISEVEHADTSTTATMEIFVNVTNTFHLPVVGAQGMAVADTLIIPCIAAQLVTVRVQNGNGNACGLSYRLRFDLLPNPFANDPLPNDDFNNPQPLVLGSAHEGHLAHVGDATSDHYGLTLPDDGTLRIIAEAGQYDPLSTAAIEVYVDQSNSYAYIPVGPSFLAEPDTFLVPCLRAGALTVRLQPGPVPGCGLGYRVRFDLIPPVFDHDPEPNESAADAVLVQPDTDQNGHITYLGTSPYDHFKLWKGFSGTMRLIIASSTEGPSPALNLWTLNAGLNENVTTGVNGAIAYDTVLITTANPDTIILRVSATSNLSCGSYRFRYEGAPVGIHEGRDGADDIVVLPNPSVDGRFTLRSSGPGITGVTVQDLRGGLVDTKPVLGAQGAAVDLSGLGAGTYTALVRTKDGRARTLRLLVLH